MIEKVSIDYFHERLDEFLESEEPRTYCMVYDRLWVNFGTNEDCNTAWCEEHGIPYFNIKRGAGCIVSAPGNIALVDIRKTDHSSWLMERVLKGFVSYLKSLGLNAEYSNNDVMVDGFKVASGVSQNLGPDYTRQYTALQISLHQEHEVIKNVCLKPCAKQPKGLSDWGLTTEEVENWIIKNFDNL